MDEGIGRCLLVSRATSRVDTSVFQRLGQRANSFSQHIDLVRFEELATGQYPFAPSLFNPGRQKKVQEYVFQVYVLKV